MTIHFSRRCATVGNNPNLFHVAIQQLESNAPHCRRVFMVTTYFKKVTTLLTWKPSLCRGQVFTFVVL